MQTIISRSTREMTCEYNNTVKPLADQVTVGLLTHILIQGK